MNKLKLSIITVNFNNSNGLTETLKSIEQQSFCAYEHIIVDGGSTDTSKEVILEYEKRTSKLAYWVSEQDKGIYDGMNKGIQQAKGEYLYFLNSGDCLINDILQAVTLDGTQYVYAKTKLILPEKEISITPPNTLDLVFFLQDALPHQACFIHRSLFKHQEYSTKYKIISDWIHSVQSIILEGCSYKFLPLTVSICDGTGVSSNRTETQCERDRWLTENLPSSIYRSILELSEFKKSEFYSIIPILNKTRKFQKRAKKIILFLYHINNLFSSRHSPK